MKKPDVSDAGRPMIAHVITIDTKAKGIGFLVTPADTEGETPLKARTTSQFLEDTNVNSAEDLLVYTLNTEVAGLNGTFSGVTSRGVGVNGDESARWANPGGVNRARLSSQSLKRAIRESVDALKNEKQVEILL